MQFHNKGRTCFQDCHKLGSSLISGSTQTQMWFCSATLFFLILKASLLDLSSSLYSSRALTHSTCDLRRIHKVHPLVAEECKCSAFFFFSPTEPQWPDDPSVLAQKWQGGGMLDCGVIWWPVACVCERVSAAETPPPQPVLSPQETNGPSCAYHPYEEMNKIEMRHSSDSPSFKWCWQKPWIVSGSLCSLCWWNEICIVREKGWFFFFFLSIIRHDVCPSWILGICST